MTDARTPSDHHQDAQDALVEDRSMRPPNAMRAAPVLSCLTCGGRGWVVDHDEECYETAGDCVCDGRQVRCDDPRGHADPCTHCDGNGQVWDPTRFGNVASCHHCTSGWIWRHRGDDPERLPDVEWSTHAGSVVFRLGMTIWPVIREVRFDLTKGEWGVPPYEHLCSNLTVEGARALRDNLDRFLVVCDIEDQP